MEASADRALSRALADERRSRLAEELRGSADGLDARELARRLELHPNTIRWHLGVLEEAGAVSSSPAPTGGRGRPRIVYRLNPGVAAGGRDEYRLLATILSGTLAQRDDGTARAEDAGRAWGRYLVARPLPLAKVGAPEATARVAELLGERGYAAQAGDGEIRMRRCPFLDLAETQPEIVCAVHRGLIDGAFEELGADVVVERLDVLVEPDLCVARLAAKA